MMVEVSKCKQELISHTSLRVLYSLYKVMTKHSVDGLSVSLILFMQFSTCKLGIHGNKNMHIAIIHPLTLNWN